MAATKNTYYRMTNTINPGWQALVPQGANAYYDPTTGLLPTAPNYQSLIDPDTGLMKTQYQSTPELGLPQLQTRLDAINQDTSGLDAFKQEALRTTPSQWANLSNQQLVQQQAAARDQAAAQSQGSAAQARTQLAMKGGLGGGAAERLARSSGLDLMKANQQIAQQGQQQRMDISMADENKRMQALGQLPGMQVQALQPQLQKTQMWQQGQQFDLSNRNSGQALNLQNAIQQQGLLNQWNQNTYNQNMQAWAANQQANAQAAAGNNSGSWVCTEVNRLKPLSKEEKKLLLKFKSYCVERHREPSNFYLNDCDELVERMKEAGVDFRDFIGLTNAMITLSRTNKLEMAYVVYRDTMLSLIQVYWPECKTVGYIAALTESEIDTRINIDEAIRTKFSLTGEKSEEDMLRPLM